jgi:hypothetical protein
MLRVTLNKLHLHVCDIFEDEGLIEFGVKIFSVHLRLVFGFLVRQQVDLDERVGQAGGPIRRGKV